MKSFDEIRNEARLLLKEDRLRELRDLLQIAAKRGYVNGGFSRSACPLNTKAGKGKIRESASALIESPMITPTGLKEQGWTDTLIKKYLGSPDVLAKNPHYKSAAPMRLYSRARVASVISQSEVQAAIKNVLSKREGRQAAAAKAIATRTLKLREWVDALKIEIPIWDIDKLLHDSVQHYGWHHDFRKDASIHDSPDFLERITYNYLRHCCSDYEYQLSHMAGKVGITELYPVLKNKVNGAISEAYPDLYCQILDYQANYARIQAEKKAAKAARNQAKKEEALARDKAFEASLQADGVAVLYSWLSRKVKGFQYPPKGPGKKKRNYIKRVKKLQQQFTHYAEIAGITGLPVVEIDPTELRYEYFLTLMNALSDLMVEAA